MLTASMTEGLVLLNQKGTILSINLSAAKLFQTDPACIGKDIVSINRTLEFTDILCKAKTGHHAETVMDFGHGKYQVHASPVTADDTVSGIVLLLLDVAEKENAEQLRREFTANVFHEPKTPLHTISGSAELMANGMVKTADMNRETVDLYAL